MVSGRHRDEADLIIDRERKTAFLLLAMPKIDVVGGQLCIVFRGRRPCVRRRDAGGTSH